MTKLTFWQGFNLNSTELRVINELGDGLEFQTAQNVEMQARVTGLQKALTANQKELADTRLVLAQLATLLEERGVIEESVFRARIDVAIALRDGPPAPVAPTGGDPYRTAAAAPMAPSPERRCTLCGKHFPENTLNILPDGLACDRCVAMAK